jgi:hypothetical protein
LEAICSSETWVYVQRTTWRCIREDRTLLIFQVCIIFYFIYLVCEAIGTAATPGLLFQPRVRVKMIVEKQIECRLAGKTEVLGENRPQCHFCPSQNPTWPDPGWTRATAVGSRRLTAWAMATPFPGMYVYDRTSQAQEQSSQKQPCRSNCCNIIGIFL